MFPSTTSSCLAGHETRAFAPSSTDQFIGCSPEVNPEHEFCIGEYRRKARF
jgi:hypothetical protein